MQAHELEQAIDSIRVRFGTHALTRAAELPPPQAWPTHSAVDGITGIGGLPRGRLSLFTGAGTSGKLTVALSLVARATHDFAHVIVVDGGGFDPAVLLPFSPELGVLTVVRAHAPEVAGEAATTLARAGAGFLMVTADVPEHWLGPLESAANRSSTAVLGVFDSVNRAVGHASSFTVAFTRSDWIFERGLLVGIRTSARCVKNRVGPPVGVTELVIRYSLGPRGLGDYAPGVVEVTAHREEMQPRASAAV
jgi:recA bacterial DNA recombination protein